MRKEMIFKIVTLGGGGFLTMLGCVWNPIVTVFGLLLVITYLLDRRECKIQAKRKLRRQDNHILAKNADYTAEWKRADSTYPYKSNTYLNK